MDDFQSIWDHSYKFVNNSITIKIHEDLDAGLGGTLFDGSVLLCKYIETIVSSSSNLLFENKNVIELGAGCGLPGLFMGHLNANVCLTDIQNSVDLLQENVDLNELNKNVQVKLLDWTQTHLLDDFKNQNYDYILAADTVYDVDLVDPFLNVLTLLCKETTKIFLSLPQPRIPKATKDFFEKARKKFDFEKIDFHTMKPIEKNNVSINPNRDDGSIQGLFILTRKTI